MTNLKEIVTKAVIGKNKKKSTEEITFISDTDIDTVLGCWIINHDFKGENHNGNVQIFGKYDINIWYSYDNNTKTNVLIKNHEYQENIEIKLPEKETNEEIIIRSLSAPTVSKVDVEGRKIKLNVEKELGAEIVGETKICVNVEENIDDYEENEEYEINEEYLNDVNQK